MRLGSQFSTLIGQAGRFAASGVVNTTLGVCVIFALTWLGVHYILANVGGYMVGLVTSFLLNKHWTFRAQGHRQAELLKFIGVFAAAYLTNLAVVTFTIEVLGGASPAAQLLGVACYVTLNFLGMKSLVFVDRKS